MCTAGNVENEVRRGNKRKPDGAISCCPMKTRRELNLSYLSLYMCEKSGGFVNYELYSIHSYGVREIETKSIPSAGCQPTSILLFSCQEELETERMMLASFKY